MFEYPSAALEAATTCLVSADYLAVDMDTHAIVLSLQEGTSSIVVHLLPEGLHDVLMVGTPSQDARNRMKLICQSIERAWRHIKFSPIAAVLASADCSR